MSVVRWLVDDMHVDPTADTDCDDFGPVHNACWNGHSEMVRMLVVEYGLDARSALQVAHRRGITAVENFLARL